MVEIAQGNLRYIEAFCLLLALSGYPIFTKLFKKQHGMPPGAYRRAFQYLGAD